MIDKLSRFGAAFNAWINTIRSTAAKTVLFVALSMGTYLVWAICALTTKPIDIAAFGAWLAFVAAVGQIALSGYKTERLSSNDYLDRGGTPPVKGATPGASGSPSAPRTTVTIQAVEPSAGGG